MEAPVRNRRRARRRTTRARRIGSTAVATPRTPFIVFLIVAVVVLVVVLAITSGPLGQDRHEALAERATAAAHVLDDAPATMPAEDRVAAYTAFYVAREALNMATMAEAGFSGTGVPGHDDAKSRDHWLDVAETSIETLEGFVARYR